MRDLSPQGKYDEIVNKPIDKKGFFDNFERSLYFCTSGLENETELIENKRVLINSIFLEDKYFQGSIADKTYKLNPAYEESINKQGWKVSYEYPNRMNAILHLKPIKPIKEKA